MAISRKKCVFCELVRSFSGWKCQDAPPHQRPYRRVCERTCLAVKSGDFDMFATVARWSHNTLLLAMALLTAALVVFAI
jgi:hypothetical protein